MSMSALLRVSSGSEADIMAGYHYPFMSSVSGPYFMLNGLTAPFWEKISQARAQFHSGQDNHFPHVRPNILRSWQRSRNANVPPVGLPLAMVGAEEFQAVLARHTTLVDTASRIMEELLENILPSKSCIVLTDADGVFLHTIGDGEGYGQGSCCLLRGIISRESVDGTTSMGMCLEEKIPVCVLGSEHYNPHYDGWSCAAAPIYDNEGELVGTLSLTLERDKFHQHTFGLVIAAAKAITEQMRLRMLLQEVQTVMELLGEAVVVLDAGGSLRLMNRYAKRLFRVRGDVLGRDFSSIATDASGKNPAFTGKKVKDGECSMLLADGTSLHCLFSSSPIPGGGLCITLRETRRVHALTNRLSGAKAVYDFGDIIGDSDAMGQALRLARMASGNSMTTLLLGESGVGKELFAQAIHNGGERRQEPFIVVNCGAIPRDLVQSELFGYEAGSFTGAAHQGAPGKFELADGGTLFLDEIGDMPQTAQISLLRVLQEGEVTRIGGKRPTRVDVRVVAATPRPLPLAVAKGSKALRKPLTGFAPAALASLEGYAWPGNVRELENLVERTAVVAKGPHIDAEDLPPEIRQDQTGDATSRRAASLTPEATAAADRTGQGRETIVAALRLTRGNVRAAAKSIGVTRATLYARILRLGLDVRDFRDAG